MTDNVNTTATPVEDRTLPGVCYALYFIGLTHGLTTIIGLIIAYASRDQAGPKMYSHYTYLIRTFWISLAGFAVGGALLLVGVPLSLILVGVPMVMAGGLIVGLAWVYMVVRLILGVIYLARDEEYPRPYAIVA
ncbi:DUF4870 family protein [Phenylobacterium soli]|uniref:DUF4870 domain-containing protein n=1 Tax=Phenylobacterium soli TaxID=2170551 RepID=A0A328AHC5_9CAUL|nr:hypothetical protein [Phenylobacterium soli]RAK54303.1 hypothetical protein DJ017_07070 [Phenylobacterium soli]